MKQLLIKFDHVIHAILPLQQAADSDQLSIEKAITMAEKFRILFLMTAIETSKLSKLKILVQTLESACLYWLRKIHQYQNREQQKDNFQNCLAQLEKRLLDFLAYLLEHFSAYFDHEQSMPLQMRQQEVEVLLKGLEDWLAIPGVHRLGLSIIQLLQRSFYKICHTENKLTFQRVQYLQKLLKELAQIDATLPADQLNLLVVECMLSLNFNHPSFIRLVTNHIWKKVEDTEGNTEKIKLLNVYYKRILQLNNLPGRAFYPDAENCCKILSDQVKEEILLLKKQESTDQKNSPIIPGKEQALSVHTGLSVPQLALLLRLLVEVGILQYSNLSELIRKIAGIFNTDKTAVISAESLRVKYYSPDNASKDILNDYLIRMRNTMRKY